jgi:uncharacterized protein RhaS with RHS repeats
MRDASGQIYMRNRYYNPATGQFTQPDPIGLAGGLNSYGFAAGDPVGYWDPFGLKVCFRGTEEEIQRLSDSTAAATGTSFKLNKGNCVTDVKPVSGEWDEVSAGFAQLASDRNVNIPIMYGVGGSRNDASGAIVIDQSQISNRYQVRGFLGICWRRGSDQYGEPAIISHELGHAWATLFGRDTSLRANNRTALRWENQVHRSRGQRERGCH